MKIVLAILAALVLLAASCDLPHGPPRTVEAPYQHGQTSPCVDADGFVWWRCGDHWERQVGVDADGWPVTCKPFDAAYAKRMEDAHKRGDEGAGR
jgi:hypothetical protein